MTGRVHHSGVLDSVFKVILIRELLRGTTMRSLSIFILLVVLSLFTFARADKPLTAISSSITNSTPIKGTETSDSFFNLMIPNPIKHIW